MTKEMKSPVLTFEPGYGGRTVYTVSDGKDFGHGYTAEGALESYKASKAESAAFSYSGTHA